jgi:hypothetical protein
LEKEWGIFMQSNCFVKRTILIFKKALYNSGPPQPEGDTMTEAFVFDAIRTPRGKGKKDGSLYEVKPVNLLAGLLTDLQQRNRL